MLWLSLLPAKNEDDPTKNKGARVATRMCHFFRRPRADNSVVSGETLPKFELIQAFMHVLNTCKNEGHCKSMGIFPDAEERVSPQSVIGSGQISNSCETL